MKSRARFVDIQSIKILEDRSQKSQCVSISSERHLIAPRHCSIVAQSSSAFARIFQYSRLAAYRASRTKVVDMNGVLLESLKE